MTQKRGLGRGLGALIPGAGSSSSAPQEEEQPLRTRRHPRTEAEPGESGSSSRPVDMFFSGDPVDSDRPARERASTRDLGGDMARAAKEKRSRSTARRGTAKSRTTEEPAAATSAASESTTDEAAEKSTTSTSAAKKTSTRSSSTKPRTRKTAATKESAQKAPSSGATTKKSTTTKSTAGKGSTSSRSASASKASSSPSSSKATASKKASSSSTTAKRSAATSAQKATPTKAAPESARDAEEPAAAAPAEAVENSPVVDVQATTSTPVGTRARKADSDETVAQSTETTSPAETADVVTAAEAVEDLVPVPGAEFAEIPIHEIRENPRNPRTMFDDDELDELAFSLREVGVLQPVVVRPIPVTENGESFELVMGERRWRAARRAGLATIPAIIRETSDDDLLRDALLENLHRSQLNPLEEAAAYQQLLEDFGCTQDELSERIGRSRPQISNTLRLMRLPALVQRRLASGALSAGHARALLALENPALMEELAQRIVTEGLSVRAVERLVARGAQPASATRTVRRSTYDPHVVDVTSRLSKTLETPVRIDVGKRKGRITLEFTNLEDLDRLVDRLGLSMGEDLTGEDSAES